SFLEISDLDSRPYFPSNNQLYLVFSSKLNEKEQLSIINIPSDQVSRFYTVAIETKTYVLFIDDIIRQNISGIYPDRLVTGIYSIKITRDADLELDNEYEGSLSAKIEQ